MKALVKKLTKFGLGFVLVANVVDVFFTMKYIFSGVLQEANPIMEPLVEHPFLFISIKTLLVCGGVIGVLIDDYDKNISLFKEHGGIVVHHQNNLSNTLSTLEEIKNGYRGSSFRDLDRGTEKEGR